MSTRFCATLAVALLPATAGAAGFQVYEQGAAATGMVGAFTAVATDASAIFYNPAGLATQRGWSSYTGSTVITGQPVAVDVPGMDPGTEVEGQRVWAPFPTFYLAYGFSNDVAVGVGAFTQFGLTTEWPQDWAGRFIATNSSLVTITINPTVAWRPLSWLSVGGGLDIVPASAELERKVNLGPEEGNLRFADNTIGWGANLGVLATWQQLTFGVSWRSQMDLDFNDGVLQFRVPAELASLVSDVEATTEVPLPNVVSVGLAAHPREDLMLQVQLDWTQWSRLEELRLETDDPAMGQVIPTEWDDGWTLRFAGEWKMPDDWALRAGLGYDWNPVPSNTLGPIVPDSDRFLISAGGSFVVGGVTADVSLMAVAFRERTSDMASFPATYDNFAALLGIAFHYNASRPQLLVAQPVNRSE